MIDGTYHMWYTDVSYQTGYTNSSDGVVWGSPVIVSGLFGHPGHAVVVNIGTETEPYYRIWYADELVWPDLDDDVIRTAESANGINWTNEQPIGQINTIIHETNSSDPAYKWIRGSYGPEAVLYTPDGYETLNETDPMGNKYVIYYDQYAYTWLTGGINEAPMLAISVDGINWKRVTDEPLIIPSGGTTEWDANYISVWSVLKRDDGYHMWYSGGIGDRNDGIGYATSADGLTWTKCAENPLLFVDDGVAWRDDRTYCPCVIEDGGVFKMWFAGKDTATGSYTLGYATIPAPLPDFYDIQLAIDTADSGDVIVVSAGTYAEAVSVTKSVTLLGAKHDVDPAGSLDRGGESVISGGNLIITADDVTVDGFKITGGYIAAGYSQALDVTISYNILEGISAAWGAIHLHGTDTGPSYHECDRGYVGYNTISGVTGHGIWTVGNDNVTIEHNHILDITGTAVDVLNHVGTGIKVLDNIITNPGEKGINYWAEAGGKISGNTITSSGWEAIYTDINATIESNHIVNAGMHGIVAASHVGTVEIIDNTITNPVQKGINYWAGAGGIIRGNIITGSGWEGIYTDINATIESNHIVDAGIHGIVAAGHVGTGIEILENTIINPVEKGINYWAGAGGIIRDNTITGSGGEAIFTDISVTIEYNTLSDCSIGITINSPASDVLVHYNNIYQNTYGVINYAESQVNATLNWWGTTDPDLIAASIIGSVVFDPWL
ncbi:MAG: right-handed parallel beta-helix repeat-containing protein, partial [Candidatus Bathyarchaeota archaeon]|nr:right-handed parallel beta-helix repeat-containing protein [Candidatus Bathyarchaeota archaeon]